MSRKNQSRRQFLRTATTAGLAGAVGVPGLCIAAGAGPGVGPGSAHGSPAQPEEPRAPDSNISVTPREQSREQPRARAVPAHERRALGANDVIRCGIIGVGNRGSALLQAMLERQDVAVVAVADTYDIWRDRAVGWCKSRHDNVSGYVQYRKMLDRESIDAVVIATPDHLHAPMMHDALDRGLDVYVEKPMTLRASDAEDLIARVAETGAVVQVGTQLRSTEMYQQAREMVQSGAIGQIVRVCVNRDVTSQGMGLVPPEANSSNVDWEAFLGDAPKIDFDPQRYFCWRHFEDYSNGVLGDLMTHHLDICHFITGCSPCTRVAALGGIYALRDGRTCPDTVSVIAEYPEEFQFNYTTTLANGQYGLVERYVGTAGAIEIRDMSEMAIYREDVTETVKSSGPDTEKHLEDFFAAMRSRGATISPPASGGMAVACCDAAVRFQRRKWTLFPA